MTAKPCDIVLIDDEKHIRTACTQALELAGFNVKAYDRADAALEYARRDWPGIIVTDIKMPGSDGLQLMHKVLDVDPELPVVLITGHGDIPMAISAMRGGAYEFIEKPFASDLLVETVTQALADRTSVLKTRSIQASLDNNQGLAQSIIGTTPLVEKLRGQIIQFGQTDADVLIHGETGSGKELVARSLHQHSLRKSEKFIAINCGALPDSIIESELFGHEAGAFTGANKQRIGKFEYANGGTLFLDEIESMPMDVQIKLLRVLQERVIERLGSNELVPVDIRIIAATKKDLKVLGEEGKFREDLYYRLNILALYIPALRERMDDAPLLFQHFVNQAALRYKCTPPVVTADLIDRLMHYEWPGNVRELQNAALRFSLGLGVEDNEQEFIPASSNPEGQSLSERISEIEKQIIERELIKNRGNLKATYEALGVSRKTLYDKMRKFNLDKEALGPASST